MADLTTDKQIAEILATFGEPLVGNVWRVQGTAVIYHKALERIAAQAKIRFDLPVILRAERDECVMQVAGRRGDAMEWSIGEACIGTNYRVSGKQAAYPYAMAEKRAKDRVILKLIGLHGMVYSEEEADEFKRGERDHDGGVAEQRRQPALDDGSPDQDAEILRGKIANAKTINAVTDLMLDPKTQKALGRMAPGIRDDVREKAKGRLVALGWPRGAASDAVMQ